MFLESKNFTAESIEKKCPVFSASSAVKK